MFDFIRKFNGFGARTPKTKSNDYAAVICMDINWGKITPTELETEAIKPLINNQDIGAVYICGPRAKEFSSLTSSQVKILPVPDERQAVLKASEEHSSVFRYKRTARLKFPLNDLLVNRTIAEHKRSDKDGYLHNDFMDLPYAYAQVEAMGPKALTQLKEDKLSLDWLKAKAQENGVSVTKRTMTNEERISYLNEEAQDFAAFPKFIALESTRLCNLKCTMCVTHSETIDHSHTEKYPRYFDLEKYQWIVDQMEPYKDYVSINPQFQGEPFMAPKVRNMIDYAKGKGMSVGFTSNAIIWNDKIITHMIESGVNSVCVSVDGDSTETYNKIRKGGDFTRFLENLDRFLELREKLSKTTPKTPILTLNWTKIPENQHEVQNFIKRWIDKAWHVSINNVVVDDAVAEKFFEPEERYPCPYLWEGMHILTNGDVVACCRDWKYEEIMGNAYETPIMEIWNNEKYRRFRRLHLAGKWDEIPICANCDTWMCKSNKQYREGDIMIQEHPTSRVYKRIQP